MSETIRTINVRVGDWVKFDNGQIQEVHYLDNYRVAGADDCDLPFFHCPRTSVVEVRRKRGKVLTAQTARAVITQSGWSGR